MEIRFKSTKFTKIIFEKMRRFSLLTLLALLPWMLGAQQLRLLVGTYTEGTPAEGV